MMGFKNRQLAIMVVVLLDLICFHSVWAFGISPKSWGTPPRETEHSSDLNLDLASLVRPLTIGRSETYTTAISLLASMQAAPSCNRIAASMLLSDCQSIDGSSPSTEISIEHVRSIYAAQLAMCEIVSAGSTIPHQCKSLEPTKAKIRDPGPSGFAKATRDASVPGQNEISSHQLGLCLHALESRPQWWTSYSNSRQNAVVMCKAAQEDIAKDDMIKLHKSMAHTNAEAHSALSKAVQQAHQDLTRHSEFTTAVENFQQRLLRDLESSSAEYGSIFANVVKGLESFTQSTVDRLRNAVKSVESDFAHLDENIRKSTAEAADLQRNIGRVFQQAVTGSAELAASQTEQWHANHDLATKLESSLESLRETEMRNLLGVFDSMHSELRMSNDLISQLYLKQSSLDERLTSHDRLLATIESNAEAIHATQAKQVDSQIQMFDQMQTEMHVARGLLTDITESAATLQASVKDASTHIASMATIGGITTSVLRWGWSGLVLFVLYLFNPRYAGFAIVGLGTFSLIWASGIPSPFDSLPADTVLIHYASGYQVPLIPTLKITTLLLTLTVIGLIYRQRSRFRMIYDGTLSITSKFPFTSRTNNSLDATCGFKI